MAWGRTVAVAVAGMLAGMWRMSCGDALCGMGLDTGMVLGAE